MSQLYFSEDVAMAVDGRVAGGDDGAIGIEGIGYAYMYKESGRQESGCEGLR